MRRAIETVPRDGNVVILEDDATGTYDVAHWSAEAHAWVGETGELSKITPTYWHAMQRDKYHGEGESSGASTSRARRFLPFSSGRVALQRPPVTGDDIVPRQVPSAAPAIAVVEAETALERGPPAWRRFAVSTTAAAMVAASLIGMYFRAEVAAYVTRYAGQQETRGLGTVGAQESQNPSQDSQKGNSVVPNSAVQQQAEADLASFQRGWWDTVKQTAEAMAPDAGPPLEKRGRAGALANELAETRRDIVGRFLQQEALAKAAQSLQQEQEKTAALAQDVATLRDEQRASAVQHRQELAQERNRGEVLASELARAQRDLETQVALSGRAGEEAAQVKQAAESATAELRQSLQKEQGRAEALTSELAKVRRDLKTQEAASRKTGGEAAQVKQAADSATAELRQALQNEQDRAEALARDLARAQRDLETQAALTSKMGEEAAQVKQAAESTAELRQSLQKERDRAEALTSELAKTRRDIETQAALSRTTGDETAQVKPAAETAMAELRLSRQKEHDSAAALARGLVSTRRPIGARMATLERAADSQLNQTKPAAGPAAAGQPAAAEVEGSPEAARLLARAKVLLGQGNIGGARVVLERAAETGSAQAIFALAETYDPLVLSTWSTYGTRGDTTKARELYARAYDGGIKAAKDRSDALLGHGARQPASWFGREGVAH